MEKVKIKIRILGGLKHQLNLKILKNWDTSFFEIVDPIDSLKNIPNSTNRDSEGYFYYSDVQLKEIIGTTNNNQIVMVLINQKLQDDDYERRIGKNCMILSLYETAEIVLENDFKIEYFIIQELYYIASLYYRNNSSDFDTLKDTHHDLRNCLFDYNNNKSDIAFSLGKVSICDSCKADFDGAVMPDNFVINIKRELSKIKQRKYFKIRNWIRKRPILSIIIGIITSILLNILSNFIYDFVKHNSSKKEIIKNSSCIQIDKNKK